MLFNDFFFQAEDGIRDYKVTGVQTCALPIYLREGSIDRHRRFGVDIAALRHRLGLVRCAGLRRQPGAAECVDGEIGRASCRERVRAELATVATRRYSRLTVRSPDIFANACIR